LVAIATTETGAWSNDPTKQAGIVSYAGAVGIMQIMPQFQPETATELGVPRINVAVGARILAKLSQVMSGELPAIASGYNAGSGSRGPHCSAVNEWNMASDANYPRQALQYNNAALLYLKLNAMSTMGMMLGGSIAGGLALAAYKYWPRR
jgi:soluble lytic murein transglycosylase-like protein